MAAPLNLQLFGSMRVLHGAEEITHFRTQKTAVLLAYLACFAHRSHPREELIDLLWPEVDRESGRMSLRTALTALRRQLEVAGVLPDDILLSDRLTVRLSSEAILTDVQLFETAMRNSARAQSPDARVRELTIATGLYQGPLLRGFYEDWILRERQRLETMFHGALQDLGKTLEAQGQYESALQIALRWVDAEPLDEEAHLLLMRLYAALGQFDGARRQLREWERLLRSELDEPASEAGRALLQQLLRSETTGSPTRRSQPAPTVGETPQPAAAPAAPDSPSSLAPSALPLSGLPTLLTRFFGREEEMERIQERALVGQARLLTLTGPGGTGKTRLALEIAHRLAPHFDNAIWFVPLMDIAEPEGLPIALVKALSLPLRTEIDPLTQAMERLARQPSLLVFDNFEHLVEGAGSLVADLLSRLPTLTCIVTSRQRLDVGGEQEFALLPLPIPQTTGRETAPQQEPAPPPPGGQQDAVPATADSLISLLACPSVQLFLDRARSARSDFQLTSANAAVVAALCAKLEGIPLAIELTAAWAQTLTPTQMLERLNRRFDLLTSRRKDLPARHRTLRAAIEWSYRLLTPELQRQFARLSVFSGGWTLEAAEAVCRDAASAESVSTEAGNAPSMLEACSLLAERSLILTEEAGHEMRYRLLDSLREYAAEQLTAVEREAGIARHRDYFLDLAERAYTQLRGREHPIWLVRLEQELSNLRSAMRSCLRSHQADSGLRIAGALDQFWYARGYAAEGRQWIETFLAEEGELDPATRARALAALGGQLEVLGELEQALLRYEQSAALYTELQDRAGLAGALHRMFTPMNFHRLEGGKARNLLERSLALYRAIGDVSGIALVLCKLGSAVRDQGDEVQAEALYQQAIALYRQLGDRTGLSVVLGELGYLRCSQGAYAEASILLEENLTICREMKHKHNLMHGLWLLGRVREMQADYVAARHLFFEAVAVGREIGARQGVVNSLNNLGIVAELETDYATAYGWYRQAMEMCQEINNLWGAAYSQADMAHMKLLMESYAEAEMLARQSLERHRAGSFRRRVPDCLLALACAAARLGQPERSARLFGGMEAMRAASNAPLSAEEREFQSGFIASIRNVLGEAAFLNAWQQGTRDSFDEVLAFALDS